MIFSFNGIVRSNNTTSNMCDNLIQAIADKFVNELKREMASFIAAFAADISTECNIPIDQIKAIMNKKFPTLATNITKDHSKASAKVTSKTIVKNVVTCQHVFTTGKNVDTECGKACKDTTPIHDGNVYCTSHRKAHLNRHSCEFEYGEKHEKCGTLCGTKVVSPDPLESGEYENCDYSGKWICKKHVTMIEKNASKVSKTSKTSKATNKTNKTSKDSKNEVKPKNSSSSLTNKKSPNIKPHPKGEDLIVNVSFLKPTTPEYIEYKYASEDGDEQIVYVDKNSGIVTYNNSTTDTFELTLFGIWNNEEQFYSDEISDECAAYAAKIGVPQRADQADQKDQSEEVNQPDQKINQDKQSDEAVTNDHNDKVLEDKENDEDDDEVLE